MARAEVRRSHPGGQTLLAFRARIRSARPLAA